jgi:hypothetical protein
MPRPASFGIEWLAAECLPKDLGVRRFGEAVNQMPAVLMEERMMPRSQRQILAKAFDDRAVGAGAPVGGYDDLVWEFAIEAALAVFAFAPRRAMTRASRLPEILRHFAEGL